MSSIGVRVSGNVISELSDKIPSHIVALNELTKNAYDAFATEVIIKLDTINNKLIIKDNGLGMDDKNIRKLFHISNSEKKYGKLIKNKEKNLQRYTQGSKGLGFLSVFKFGSNVTWITNKNNKKIIFSVNKDDLISRKNVASYRLITKEEPSTEIGTTIFIELERFYTDVLEKYFSQEKNIKKIINAFYDEQFKITLETNHGLYESEKHSNFINIANEDQLFYITYSSTKAKIKFFYCGDLIKEIPYIIHTEEYELDVELMAYSLQAYGKRKISQLYYREHDDALTPLIYINNNLFHNYTLFDANLFRQKKSGESLPQLIGYIKIISSHTQLEFNSDRTQFVQNQLTLNIENTLKELNKIIQKEGSNLRHFLKEEDDQKIKTGSAFPYEKKLETNDNSKNKILPQPAQIKLREKIKKIHIPSKQIDLLREITYAINSEGKQIDLSKDIQIEINNNKIINSILESQEQPCEKLITYIYNDYITGKLVEKLILKFELPEAKILAKNKKSLFNLPSTKDYSINIPYVSNLILQLEKLHKEKGDYYNGIIACTLRSIFELCCDYLKNNKSTIFKSYSGTLKLESCIAYIISFIGVNDNLKHEISKITGINYTTLNNLLDKNAFLNAIKKAHLGVHKSTAFLTDLEVKDLAKKAGIFATLSDALLYNVTDNIIIQCKIPNP